MKDLSGALQFKEAAKAEAVRARGGDENEREVR